MKSRIMLRALVLAAIAPFGVGAQQHQQAREWHCVKQPMVEDTNGNVLALNCEAALPKTEKMDAEDEDTLSKLARIRASAMNFKTLEEQDPKNSSAGHSKIIETIRMGFGQAVGQICQKHPSIVLAPLFPDSGTGTFVLYGCKNIFAAPEK